MINNNISYYLTLTFWLRPLRGELHSFCGTWLRCNFLEWNGAPKRRPRGPAKRGSGSVGDAATAFTYWGARILLRGRTFLRKACSALRGRIPRRCALPCTPKTAHFTPSNYRI